MSHAIVGPALILRLAQNMHLFLRNLRPSQGPMLFDIEKVIRLGQLEIPKRRLASSINHNVGKSMTEFNRMDQA